MPDEKVVKPKVASAPRGPMMRPAVSFGGDKPKAFGVSLRKLLRALKPFRVPMIVTIVFAFISTAFAIVSPRILGEMTNQIVSDLVQISMGVPGAALDYQFLTKMALILSALFIVSAAFNLIQSWVIAGVTTRFVRLLRRDISRKINRMPISYFDKHAYGDTMSRVVNDVETIAQSLNNSLAQIISSITMLIGIIIMMLSISFEMSLVAAITLPVGFVFIAFITKKSQPLFKAQQNYLGTLNGHIEETYSGQTIVRVFSAETDVLKRFDKENQRLYNNAWKSQFLSGLMMPMMHFISNLGYVGSVVTGGWLAINGRISIGDIQAFIQYVNQLNQPMVQVAQIMNIIQSTVAAAERVFDFLEEPEITPDPAPITMPGKIRGEVEFRDVNFSYDPGTRVIHDFSVSIKPGSRVAIVGPTGAGKTTIVNLLMRFYDPDSGQIFIDGIDTRTMPRSQVRAMFGMVLQDTWLMSGTIEENLKYSDPSAHRRDVMRVSRAAHVDHYVQSLPDGYKTKLDEDSDNISVGEKQLLTIARAMLGNAPMMILDEATSNVDTRTEILIQDALNKLSAGRTSFVIAHRLSTVREADIILVMKDGNIMEQGKHTDLMKKGGFYADLYNSQFVEE